MNTNPLTKGILAENFLGVGTVTRQMVHMRAKELAIINGRSAQDVSQSDWSQAKRELLGESDTDPKDAILESAPESARWDLLPGSVGHQAPESSSEEADDEGHSISEQLVDEGLREADHDQRLQSALDKTENS